ncbi:hypothetical protein [Roseovarius sp.]|uniref:hypothetical protein n=1 Tax=Roseovarius sp. TaxID=1486281 RepID=UPI003515AECE
MQASIWDRRRKAPFHFLAKSENARMSAYLLSNLATPTAEQLATEAGYKGNINVVLGEAFKREASIALELILKAILCIKARSAPTPSHDVYKLWQLAGLPKLTDEDYIRLIEMTEILYWAGRYAAPTKDKHLEKARAQRKAHAPTSDKKNGITIKPLIRLGWDEFAAIYEIASGYFWDLKPNDPDNFVT